MATDERLVYWDSFYGHSNQPLPLLPSQFAAFALGEMATLDASEAVEGVIEFGCGNGRDSHFFAAHGFDLLALDASAEAIDRCRAGTRHARANFVQRSATDAREEVERFMNGKKRVAVYARFFLHAIREEEQNDFLMLLGDVLLPGSLLFLEYRTVADAEQQKVFGDDHYRRYLDHRTTLANIEAAGFSRLYEIEGHGFAKFRAEDARVGRCVAIRNAP
ncbi:class I SAM-dependent methyltransferase [Pseudomonas sp. NPDC089547]|uniref:class I SAM-dependent methyltransferase n=1 Tax=Pseudomonas sp. NPDC089547 TaxID=3390652 RepID=UPI003D067C62